MACATRAGFLRAGVYDRPCKRCKGRFRPVMIRLYRRSISRTGRAKMMHAF